MLYLVVNQWRRTYLHCHPGYVFPGARGRWSAAAVVQASRTTAGQPRSAPCRPARASLLDPFGDYRVQPATQQAVDVCRRRFVGVDGRQTARVGHFVLSAAQSALETGDSFGFIGWPTNGAGCCRRQSCKPYGEMSKGSVFKPGRADSRLKFTIAGPLVGVFAVRLAFSAGCSDCGLTPMPWFAGGVGSQYAGCRNGVWWRCRKRAKPC